MSDFALRDFHRETLETCLEEDLYFQRKAAVEKYSFAVITEEVVSRIGGLTKELVEIGAGTGYWAHVLSKNGIKVHAYDRMVNSSPVSKNSYGQIVGLFHPVKYGTESVLLNHTSFDLLLVWPPYDTLMADECLKYWLRGKGRYLFYVGEGYGGCTGTDSFHDELDDLGYVGRVDLPKWPGINDNLYIYERF